MEGRKENKYNLSGICPQCGKLLKVELVVATELVETGTTKAKEELPDANKGESEGTSTSSDEGDSVRPADETGPAGTADTADKPVHSGKGKRDKKAGGR